MKPSGHFKSGLALVVASLAFVLPVFAMAPMDYYRITREPALVQALELLEHSTAAPSVGQMLAKGTRVLFKDMREFGKVYRNHDALTIIADNTNQQVIYINSRHMGAPPQALAAIISHEALHDDRDNSIQEEVVAWSREAATWKEMLQQYPTLKQIPMGKVPLVDRLNAILALENQNKLEWQIQTNVAYQGLPARSPGF